MYFKESENGNFKFEVDAHQLDLRLHHFSQFPLNVKKKKIKSWQVCDWLAKWLIMLGYMNLRQPRVYRRSNVGLVTFCCGLISYCYDPVINIFMHQRFIFRSDILNVVTVIMSIEINICLTYHAPVESDPVWQNLKQSNAWKNRNT